MRRRLLDLIALCVLTCVHLGCEPGEGMADLAITRVSIVNIDAGTVKPNQTILVSGERIVEVLPSDQIRVPPATDVLDGRGLFAIPGLWDMHVHALWDTTVAATFLPELTRHGVTGIRDMGGDMEVLQWARSMQETEQPPWPRIVAAGQVLDGPDPVDPSISVAVSTPEDGVQAVHDLSSAGADFIKVYTLLPRDAYFAILEVSSTLGVHVVGHVPASVSPLEAAEAGQVGIEHLMDELGTFCARGAESQCDALVDRFRALGTHNTPTLVVLEAKSIPGYRPPENRGAEVPVPETVHVFWEESRQAHLQHPEGYFEERKAIFAWELDLVARLAGVGAPLLAGSDAGNPFIFPGPGLHRELELMVEAGLTPRAALATATSVPARFLGISDSFGAINAGYVADIVLLSGNPMKDISNVRQITKTVLRGEVLDANTQASLPRPGGVR